MRYSRLMMARNVAPKTDRYTRRKLRVLDVASAHINELGVRGMTLTGVAQALGLDTSSVTYYFRRKDDLAYACLERTLLWMRERTAEAASASGSIETIRQFVRAHIRAINGDEATSPHLAMLSDLHSMQPERREELYALYAESVHLLRPAFGDPGSSRSLIATLVLLATVHWLPTWLWAYADDDMPRVEDRLTDILACGFAPGANWPVTAVPPVESDSTDPQSRFLLAATALINRDGYHGASVGKIAAELGVSTGSFYHHLRTKDDLVLACFGRTFDLIEQARDIGNRDGENRGVSLAMTLGSLLHLQSDGPSPLLRSSAYQALPPPLRDRMLRQIGQMTQHFIGVIADGVAEGSIRAIDPVIAGHVYVSVMNAAADSRAWGISCHRNAAAFVDLLSHGLTGVSRHLGT